MEPGTRVSHPSWGEGTVLERSDQTALDYELVKFDKYGQKRVARYALDVLETDEEEEQEDE